MEDISALLLSGGKGTRLKSVLKDLQKTMVEINGEPFINKILDQLNKSKISNVVVCLGYKGSQFKVKYGNKFKATNLVYSQEEYPLGTGGALRLGLEKTKSKWILALNGDSYLNISLDDFVNASKKFGSNISICSVRVDNISRYGSLNVSNNVVLNFQEKSNLNKSGYINAGIYLFKRDYLLKIPKNLKFSIEKDFFPNSLSEKIYCYTSKESFIDIGTPKSLKQAEHFFDNI